jgi:hypothetical protein
MKLTVLAAVALVSLTGPAFAPVAITTPIVPRNADSGGCSGCNIQRLDEPAIPQTPDYSSGCNNCARPTPPQVKVVDGAGCSNCAVETLDKPIIPVEPADAGGCSSCATPTSPTQKIADNSATEPIVPSSSPTTAASHTWRTTPTMVARSSHIRASARPRNHSSSRSAAAVAAKSRGDEEFAVRALAQFRWASDLYLQ